MEALRIGQDRGVTLIHRHGSTDWALAYVLIAAAIAVLWFAVRGLARRGVRWAAPAYARVDPYVQAAEEWFRSAPATFIYMAVWLATTILIQGASKDLVDALTEMDSSNLAEVMRAPTRAILVSGLLVADRGAGILAYVVIFVLIVARLEQRLGTPRTLIVWLCSHVFATLMVLGMEETLIDNGLMRSTLETTLDVGVSYVMVGSMGAYMLFVSRRWRWWYYSVLFLGIVVPVFVDREIWDLGHLLATLIGVATGALLSRWGVRPRLYWRPMRGRPARPLQSVQP